MRCVPCSTYESLPEAVKQGSEQDSSSPPHSSVGAGQRGCTMRIPSGSGSLFTASPPCIPAAGTSARVFRQLRSRRTLVPALVLAILVVGLVVTAAGYFGARGMAIDHAQTSTSAGARADEQMLLSQGGPIVVSGTTMSIGPSSKPVYLNNNTIAIRVLHDLSGQNVTIYALNGLQLTAIATDIPGPNGKPALDMPVTGAAYDALVGQCGPSATSSACHQTYSGQASLAGRDYITSMTPLYDANGTFVGALGTAVPLATVLAPATRLALLLAIICVLLDASAVVGGLLFFAPLSSTLLRKLDRELTDVATYASELEHLSRSQVARTQRQERMARQTHEVTRHLDDILDALEQGQAALRDSTSEIWAGMSQPGQALEPTDATRLARQAAITAGRIGAATEDARDRCRNLVALMNQVIAEGRVLNQSGQQVEDRAAALRQAIEQVEMTLGAQVVARQYGLGIEGLPFGRHLSGVSRRIFRRDAASDADQHAASAPITPGAGLPGRPPIAHPLASLRPAPRSTPLPGHPLAGWTNPSAPVVGGFPEQHGAHGPNSHNTTGGQGPMGPARPGAASVSRPLDAPPSWPAYGPVAGAPSMLPGMMGDPIGRLPGEGNAPLDPGSAAPSQPADGVANTPSQWPANRSQPHGYVPWLRSQPGLPGQPSTPPRHPENSQVGQGVPWAPWLGTPEPNASGPSIGARSQMRRQPISRPLARSDAAIPPASPHVSGFPDTPGAASDAAAPAPDGLDWLITGQHRALPRQPAPEPQDANASQPPRDPPRTGWIND